MSDTTATVGVPPERLAELAKPFPPERIKWRPAMQGVTREGKPWAKGFAYLDARDVQDRLDHVVGPQNWQTEYEHGPSGGLLCRLSIRVNGEWITKADGATNKGNDSKDPEMAIKGGLSDAFKRAAVHWGIGRYLYSMPDSFLEVTVEQPKDRRGWTPATIKLKDGREVYYWWRPPKGVLPGEEPQSQQQQQSEPQAQQQSAPPAQQQPPADPFLEVTDRLTKAKGAQWVSDLKWYVVSKDLESLMRLDLAGIEQDAARLIYHAVKEQVELEGVGVWAVWIERAADRGLLGKYVEHFRALVRGKK